MRPSFTALPSSRGVLAMAAEDSNAAPTAKASTAQWGLIAFRMNAQPCRARRRLSAGLAVAVADLIEARFIVRLAGSCSLGYRFWRPVATFRQPLGARSSLRPTLRLGRYHVRCRPGCQPRLPVAGLLP